MKRKLSLRMVMLCFFILPGIVQMLSAVSHLFFRIPDIVLNVVAIGTLLLIGYSILMSFRNRSEPEDEMARKNLNYARTFSWCVIIFELIGLLFYSDFSGKPVMLTGDVVFILLASMFLVYGILFLVLDKWGKV